MRGWEVRVAAMEARLESSDVLARQVGAAVSETSTLKAEIARVRDSYYSEIILNAKRDKEAAEAAALEAHALAEARDAEHRYRELAAFKAASAASSAAGQGAAAGGLPPVPPGGGGGTAGRTGRRGSLFSAVKGRIGGRAAAAGPSSHG